MAEFSGSDAEPKGGSKSSLTGLAAGVYGNWSITERLEILSEFLYIQKGATMRVSDPDVGTVNETWNLSYIEMPMLVRYVLQLCSTKVGLFGGPYAAWNLKSEVKAEILGVTVTIAQDGYTNFLEYGIQFGIGASIGERYTVDGRYSMGLTTIGSSTSADDIKNSGFFITLGYQL